MKLKDAAQKTSTASIPLYLGHLLHLTDSTLPIGAYNHSNGLETAVQQGLVKDANSLSLYVHDYMAYNMVNNDAAYLNLAFEAIVGNDLQQLLQLDQELYASKTAREAKEATCKLGIRLLKIFSRYTNGGHPLSILIHTYTEAVKSKSSPGTFPIVFALFAIQGAVPKVETLYAFFYNALSATVTNGVKLVPLSQMDGQDIVVNLRQQIESWVSATTTLDPQFLGASCTAFDIHAMQHELLYNRIYMS